MTAYNPAAWDSFFVAQAGASAALLGLLFVGLSINLGTIARSARLVQRALESFLLFTGVLLVAVLALVPGLSREALGAGLLGVTVIVWGIVVHFQARAVATRGEPEAAGEPRGSLAMRIVFGQAATIASVIGAATLLAGSGGGLYWLVPGVVLSYTAALTNAWVLLIEIHR